MKKIPYKLILIITIIPFYSCKSEQAKQKEWIYCTLENELWDKVSYDAVNESFVQLANAMEDYSKDQAKLYQTETDRYLNNFYSSLMFHLTANLQNALGEDDILSQNKREKKYVIQKYFQHCLQIDSLFSYEYASKLDSLKNCVITDITESFSAEQICRELLGKPDSYSEPATERISEMAEANVKNILKYLDRPKISASAFDEVNAIWTVRFDALDNQYIKFYKRDDRTYDIEVSEELNDNKIGHLKFKFKSVEL